MPHRNSGGAGFVSGKKKAQALWGRVRPGPGTFFSLPIRLRKARRFQELALTCCVAMLSRAELRAPIQFNQKID